MIFIRSPKIRNSTPFKSRDCSQVSKSLKGARQNPWDWDKELCLPILMEQPLSERQNY